MISIPLCRSSVSQTIVPNRSFPSINLLDPPFEDHERIPGQQRWKGKGIIEGQCRHVMRKQQTFQKTRAWTNGSTASSTYLS
jgi:hypothetical protein